MMADGLLIVLPLVLLTGLMVRLLLRVRKTRPDLFVHAYLSAIALKLMLSLGLLVVVLVRNPEKAVMYAVVFLVAYALATAVEVWVLLRKSNS
ncbi:MAG: hypothetical protein MUC38_13795 [Cyclobacteriaceae bacterium]|jgi:hypothetical protein|nr:hypothetical protein [Cyclobacteriaceae bacterium]